MSDTWEDLDPDDLEAEMRRARRLTSYPPPASQSKTSTCSSASKSSA